MANFSDNVDFNDSSRLDSQRYWPSTPPPPYEEVVNDESITI